ncbi:Gluconeogenesis factor [Seminavis robusta]|uniref:Gluconeogenesis factor n=1 Tax=Seminavis robusta TaxID=568900 RepID=A0A9N8EPT0_9STRA|nr:Gluconeogenesis factor [Seminavis robusta]|eukprot:Sro1626_g286820.1 Gluconeogenesis factor (457) ;mRNA; f:2282-3652
MPAIDDKRSSSFADSIDRAGWEDNNQENNESGISRQSQVVVTIKRQVPIPDPRKVEQCRRLPEYGPRILCFSGGSALKDVSSCLKQYTHHSIHLITPFDSGGSSAEIRKHFHMLSVGDLRNRLMALSDDLSQDNVHVKQLFSHRLDKHDELLAQTEFSELVQGHHELCRAVSLPLRRILTSHLRWFHNRMPAEFDLRGASIGNLIITGCYLEHHADVVTAIYLIWTLLGVKGVVRPITGANLQLRARYQDGTTHVGQHLLGKELPVGKHGRIEHIDLVDSLLQDDATTRQDSKTCHIDSISAELLASADVLCYPMGSFFGSVLVNLLPRGVGRAIVSRQCPKIYIPNTGIDPEMVGLTLADCLQRIIDMVRVDTKETDANVDRIINFVLVDTTHCHYCIDMDKDRIRDTWGDSVVILDLCLVDDATRDALRSGSIQEKCHELNAQKLVEVLLTLGS